MAADTPEATRVTLRRATVLLMVTSVLAGFCAVISVAAGLLVPMLAFAWCGGACGAVADVLWREAHRV